MIYCVVCVLDVLLVGILCKLTWYLEHFSGATFHCWYAPSTKDGRTLPAYGSQTHNVSLSLPPVFCSIYIPPPQSPSPPALSLFVSLRPCSCESLYKDISELCNSHLPIMLFILECCPCNYSSRNNILSFSCMGAY